MGSVCGVGAFLLGSDLGVCGVGGFLLGSDLGVLNSLTSPLYIHIYNFPK
jgi:hypothetical protein